MEEIVKIKKSDLLDLVKSDLKLNALDCGGVDNWCNYGEALNENYFDDCSFNDVDDLSNDEFYEQYCTCYVQE